MRNMLVLLLSTFQLTKITCQKLMIAKFRERWEKLKDSAKRKKEAKAATAGVRERIVEEPEAEEELDDSNV